MHFAFCGYLHADFPKMKCRERFAKDLGAPDGVYPYFAGRSTPYYARMPNRLMWGVQLTFNQLLPCRPYRLR